MKNLFIGLTFTTLAQVLTFIQLQGQFKYAWMKNNLLATVMMGVPISYLYIISVKYVVESFDGDMWPSRLLGFAIGAIVFTIMAKCWFDEPFSLKTGVCLSLASCILAIQMLWK
jgi:hypothetical protein